MRLLLGVAGSTPEKGRTKGLGKSFVDDLEPKHVTIRPRRALPHHAYSEPLNIKLGHAEPRIGAGAILRSVFTLRGMTDQSLVERKHINLTSGHKPRERERAASLLI